MLEYNHSNCRGRVRVRLCPDIIFLFVLVLITPVLCSFAVLLLCSTKKSTKAVMDEILPCLGQSPTSLGSGRNHVSRKVAYFLFTIIITTSHSYSRPPSLYVQQCPHSMFPLHDQPLRNEVRYHDTVIEYRLSNNAIESPSLTIPTSYLDLAHCSTNLYYACHPLWTPGKLLQPPPTRTLVARMAEMAARALV